MRFAAMASPSSACSFLVRSRDALVHRGLAEVFGSAKPVLDIRYQLGDDTFADGFEDIP